MHKKNINNILPLQQFSFILIEYYSSDRLICFVNEIEQLFKYNNFEIIVVSNSNLTQQQAKEIQKQLPEIKIIVNKKNMGYANAINIGVKYANGQYLIITNPNCKFIDFDLSLIKTFFLRNNKLAVIGPQIINNKKIVQDSYRNFMFPLNFFIRQAKRLVGNVKTIEKVDIPQKVDWVIGACMVISKNIFVDLKGFDNDYFLYVEDMDFCYKAQLNGYETHYIPQLLVEYNANRRSVKGVNRYFFIHIKSYLYFLKKILINNFK